MGSKKKPNLEQMLNEISDDLHRVGEGIGKLPDGPAKVELLERLVGSYDKLIGVLKEKVERQQAKAASDQAEGHAQRAKETPAADTRPGRRRRPAK
jgi:DNA anti-recombination protein RmuC